MLHGKVSGTRLESRTKCHGNVNEVPPTFDTFTECVPFPSSTHLADGANDSGWPRVDRTIESLNCHCDDLFSRRRPNRSRRRCLEVFHVGGSEKTANSGTATRYLRSVRARIVLDDETPLSAISSRLRQHRTLLSLSLASQVTRTLPPVNLRPHRCQDITSRTSHRAITAYSLHSGLHFPHSTVHRPCPVIAEYILDPVDPCLQSREDRVDVPRDDTTLLHGTTA